MKTHLILIVIVTGLTGLKAQDYHISQYDVASLYLNPANTGMYGNEKPDYRAYLDQRSQWRSVGVKPYITSYLAYDKPVHYKDRTFGVGGYILNSNGGIGNLNTFSFMTSISYDILNPRRSKQLMVSNLYKKHQLSIGLQLGLFYRSNNPNALNYDVQYSLANGGSFDPNIPNNEIYSSVNILRFDANYGIFYKFLDQRKKYHPYAGLALQHLTRPRESLTGGDSRLPLKWNSQAGCEINVNEKVDVTPRVLYLLQSKASDLTAGVLMTYLLNEDDTRLLAAFDYRLHDAAIVSLGVKTYKYSVRLSYDINTSFLKYYTRGRGGLEVSLIYNGRNKKRPSLISGKYLSF